jgi:N-succinyldiaminopimelate aminotransferase
MNSHLDLLHRYPFEKLNNLFEGAVPASDQPALSFDLGEPQYPPPAFIAEVLAANLSGLYKYPITKGLLLLRQAIAEWLCERYQQVLPVNGTREALFAIAQAVVDSSQLPLVLMTNPIYEGAALLSGAEPYYLNTTKEREFNNFRILTCLFVRLPRCKNSCVAS